MMDIKSKFLDEILNCPDIKWKTLAEVAEIGTGSRNTNEAIDDGQYTFFVRSQKPLLINEYEFDETAIITAGDGVGVGKVFHFVVGKYALHQRAYRICVTNLELCPKFLFYYIKTYFYDYLMKVSVHASVTSLRKPMFEKYLIPIPPLPIQQKIVDILDTFTTLTAELTAELTARKQQYEYYRDELLTFGDDVEWRKFGEIATIQRGASPRPIAKYITDDEAGIPWIKIGDTEPNSKYVYSTKQKITAGGANKSRILKIGDFILSNSMSFGRPYILALEGAIHDGWASISNFDGYLDSSFLYHYLSSGNVQNYWASKINSGSVSNLNADIIKSLPIPILEIRQQKEIADILDKFDTLTSSIKEGLPREIELREQQYEYYRDLLLSFPKPEEVK